MKKIYQLFPIFLLLIAPACSTPKKTAYNTLATVGATVDTSMKVAASLKVAGKITTTQWNNVAQKHAQFQATYSVACDAAALDYTKLASNDLITIANDLVTLINSLK